MWTPAPLRRALVFSPELTSARARVQAEAWGPMGVTANNIAPGYFETELTAPVFADTERAAKLAATTALGRNGDLDDLVGLAVFLCSKASDYITGQTIYCDGGFTAMGLARPAKR